MPITILQPRSAVPATGDSTSSDSDSGSDGGADLEGDVQMRDAGRRQARLDDDADQILTPGSVITTNPQWMR